MNEGVEWALHSCVNLCWVGDHAVPAKKLAAFFELPAPYLNKQMQALVRAEILTSASGPRGGFRLARPPERITVMDVVTAIEGAESAFRCTSILADSPVGVTGRNYSGSCFISQAMNAAELAWRRELAKTTIADLRDRVAKAFPGHTGKIESGLAP